MLKSDNKRPEIPFIVNIYSYINQVKIWTVYIIKTEVVARKCVISQIRCSCSSCWQGLSKVVTPPPHLTCHAAGGGCCVGAVEHRRWRLWLLPHQCHGREDPCTGKCPLYSPVCDCGPVSRSHPAYDLYPMEKTMTKPLQPCYDLFYYCICLCSFPIGIM